VRHIPLAALHACIHPPPGSIMVCLRGYFDDSGKHDDPTLNTVSLAGYLAPVSAWEEFERLWKRDVLDEFGIAYFHMKELIGQKGPFADWEKNDKRQPALFAAMAKAIGDGGLTGFGAPLLTDALDRFNAERGRCVEAYPFTLYATVLEIWLEHAEDDIELVLDRIDHGHAKAAAAERYARSDTWYGHLPWPDILPLSPDSPKGSQHIYGLQAADFFAWEGRQSAVLKGDWLREVKPATDPKDWPLSILLSQINAKGITADGPWRIPDDLPAIIDRRSYAALLGAAHHYARVWDYDALVHMDDAKGGAWGQPASQPA